MPGPFLNGAKNQVIIANHFRICVREPFSQEVLDFVFVPDEHITLPTVSIGVVERDQIPGFYMNKQG